MIEFKKIIFRDIYYRHEKISTFLKKNSRIIHKKNLFGQKPLKYNLMVFICFLCANYIIQNKWSQYFFMSD